MHATAYRREASDRHLSTGVTRRALLALHPIMPGLTCHNRSPVRRTSDTRSGRCAVRLLAEDFPGQG
jgi:hypothetical protein